MVRRTLLVIATRTGNENLRRFQMDPSLRAQYEEGGWCVEERGLGEITWSHLQAADAVVLLQTPYVTNVEGTREWEGVYPVLQQWVMQGGGLVVFLDERYFHVMPNLNLLLEPWGLQLLQEAFEDDTPGQVLPLEHSPEMEKLATRNLDKTHPVAEGVDQAWIPIGSDGTCAFPFIASADWDLPVRGDATTRTQARWTDQHRSYETAPPMVAARALGQGGRVVIFPMHSTFHFLHGSSPRWDQGFFLKSGLGQLIENAIDWVAGSSCAPVGNVPPPERNEESLFAVHPRERQHPVLWWQSGVVIRLSEVPEDVSAWAASLAGHVDWVALAPPAADLDGAAWLEWVRACDTASSASLRLLPAVHLRDMFENRAILIAPDKWPITRSVQSLNHILHNVGGHMILTDVDTNPWPPCNIGGFHAMGFNPGAPSATQADTWNWFRRLQAADWFLLPQVWFEADTAEAGVAWLQQHAERSCIAASLPDQVRDAMPRLFNNARDGFLSSGPVLELFKLTGASVIEDPWEGVYTLWRGVQDQVVLRIRLHSEHPLREVKLFRQGRVWRRYYPEAKAWALDLPLASDHASESFWLEATDAGGGFLLSTTERTRSPTYWSHGGGDRMNTYATVMRPHPEGGMTVRGQAHTNAGGVLFGLGWGEYVDPIGPFSKLDEPAGRELGPRAGGVKGHFSPCIEIGAAKEFDVSKPERLGYDVAHEEVAIVRERVQHKAVYSDGVQRCLPAEWLEAETTYVIPRWEHEGALWMYVTMRLTPRQTLRVHDAMRVRLGQWAARDARGFNTLRGEDRNGVQSDIHWPTLDGEKDALGGPLRWSAMWPDPQGAIGVIALDDQCYASQLAANPVAKPMPWQTMLPDEERLKPDVPQHAVVPPMLQWQTIMPSEIWEAGDTRTFCFASINLPVAVTDVPQWMRAAHRGMTAHTERVRVPHGTLESAQGIVQVGCKDRLADVRLTAPEEGPLIVRFDGLNPYEPAYARRMDTGDWIPLAKDGDGAWLTVPAGADWPVRAGALVRISPSGIMADVGEWGEKKVILELHNPNESPASIRVESGVLGLKRDIMISNVDAGCDEHRSLTVGEEVV